jgi:hypothetical protein
LQKVAIGDLLSRDEMEEQRIWADQLQNAPALLDTIFKGLSAIPTLSQLATNLGTVNRGVFISGDDGDPFDTSGNNPFTGVAMMAPGLDTGTGDTASIFGMNAGSLTFWMSNETGNIIAGGGNVRLSDGGIAIYEGDAEQSFLSFYNTDPAESVAFKFADDNLQVQSLIQGGKLSFYVTLTDDSTPYMIWQEHPTVANATQMEMTPGADGANMLLGNGIVLWAGKDNVDTIFNGDFFDIDVVFKDDTSGEILRIDAAEKRLEIGQDHFIPTRNSSDPNVYFNEGNQDMDFIVEGTTDGNLIHTDAANDRLGVGTASPGYKLDVNGNVNVASGKTYKINGTDLDGANITYTPANTGHWDAGADPGQVDDALDQVTKRLNQKAEGTIADDTAISFTPTGSYGIFVLQSRVSSDLTINCMLHYRADATSAFTITQYAGSNLNVTTGTLAGTTGTDTKMTVSVHTDGKIYIENLRGGNRFINYYTIGSLS